jgi:hypothetical protein
MTTKKDNPSLTLLKTDPRKVAGSRSKSAAKSTFDDPLSHAELDFVEEVRACLVEARRRARARGLTAEAIEREVEDSDSQYWKDFREVARKYGR